MPLNKETKPFSHILGSKVTGSLAHCVKCSLMIRVTWVKSQVASYQRPKTLKMVFDTSLLNTQQYKLHIKGKVEQSRERSSALLYTSVYWKGSLQVTLDYGRQLTSN